MSGPGFRRYDMGGWHLRVVEDRSTARQYLAVVWGGRLPTSFYSWLVDGEPGSTYLLTGPVFRPERWVHPEAPGMTTAAPVKELVAVSR